jgi:hypothetical protein
MNAATQICQDERRRHEVRERPDVYGLDFVEVLDAYTLKVHFLGDAPPGLAQENVRISGGQRIRDIQVVGFRICDPRDRYMNDCMIISVDKTGDFSTYTLCVVKLENGRPSDEPYPGVDRRYACLDFSFKVDCPSGLDCKPSDVCPPKEFTEPGISYLAKDYASFRQLILDRLALIMPDWQERHVPDLGIALVEVLAYVGDHLSYFQDAVATEAYLDTARQRISVRRHARLVDYVMHEGCNARAWVHVKTETDEPLPVGKISFITGHNQVLPLSDRVLTWHDLRDIPRSQYEVFEPLVEDLAGEIQLYRSHNKIRFYTWGDQECCLPRGATTATLIDGKGTQVKPTKPGPDVEQTAVQEEPTPEEAPPGWEYKRELHLEVGDVLIFEEVVGPKTGEAADADPSRRHPVCITQKREIVDELYHQPLLEITWAEADALPFPFCISTLGPPEKGCELIENVSVARGNVILVDHGRTVKDEDLGCVPLKTRAVECIREGRLSDPVKVPKRFIPPPLAKAPLTFSQPLSNDPAAASKLSQDPRRAIPWIRLDSALDPGCEAEGNNKDADASDAVVQAGTDTARANPSGQPDKGASGSDPAPRAEASASGPVPVTRWETRRDLLGSHELDPHFVVEIDNVRRAHLRFGDGELGRIPPAGAKFKATYRVGNGLVGNVGAESINHMVLDETLTGVDFKPRNPLPARGGVDRERLEEVKLYAPHAVRRELQRAIVADDYARIVMRDFGHKVQRAAAVLRWTGSWYQVLVTVDPLGHMEADQTLLDEIRGRLHRYHRIGHDMVVRAAKYVPLDIEMTVCVLPDYLRGHVQAALLDRFSNRVLPDGGRGFFHPDKLTFGEGIYLSKLVAAAQAVPGVETVSVRKLERLHEGDNGEIEHGILPLSPLEIARADNDPNFPENGQFKLTMRGGR